MAQFCEVYWRPVNAYIRRFTSGRADVEDLTQEFFCKLIEKDIIRMADPERGRLRSFLCTLVKRFVMDEHAKRNSQKRGGEVTVHQLGVNDVAENIDAHSESPEQAFDRAWAMRLNGCAKSSVDFFETPWRTHSNSPRPRISKTNYSICWR